MPEQQGDCTEHMGVLTLSQLVPVGQRVVAEPGADCPLRYLQI